jgi:signal transduction histidine kinase
MKLRTQFAFLIIGIILVPFLVSAFILFLDYAFSRGQEPMPNYGRISGWIRREVQHAIRSNDFRALMRDRPPGLDFIVLAADDSVAFSTISQIPAGTAFANGLVMGYIRANARSFHFQIDLPRGAGAADSLVIIKFPKLRDEGEFRNQAVQYIMYSSIAVLVFSSLMSFLILRSVNRSIVTLEGATRRVAEGDYDFELPVKGSDEISSLTRSFDRMRKALKEEYARRARFIMGVSHDLKTPLALIQGYVEAITDGFAGDPEVQKRYLSIIHDKTQTLEGMIEDLIGFVKMETGEWRMTFRHVSVKEFLTGIAKRYSEDALILKRDFRFAIDLADGLQISIDEGLVNRALENLIGNAIRYTAEGGTIEMTAWAEGGEVVLSISDSGIGIPQKDITRIYDPFYRGTNSRREQGFGLGLTTVKSIIEGHGWNIGVVSIVGEGSTFTIRIPLVKAAVEEGGRGERGKDR